MTRALTLIAHNRIDAPTSAASPEAGSAETAEDIFAAFHNDLSARSKITTFPGGLKRRGF